MKRCIHCTACLLGVLLLAISMYSTGQAQSFTTVMYLPTVHYLNPCAAAPIPMITRPPTQQRLAFVHNNYQSPDTWDLYMINADNSGRTRLTNDSATESRPTWSPDAKQIAYVSNGAASASLKLLRLSDRRITTVHTWPSDITVLEPAWSPDGKQIAFSLGQNQAFNIAVIQTNGTNLRNLTSTGINRHPSWSSDGTQLVYSSRHGSFSHIYTMNADGTQESQLTNQSTLDYQPAWSPDGSRIAFTSGCLDGSSSLYESIYIIQADGSGRTHIPVPESFGGGQYDSQTQPSWSPDGTQIAYTQSFFKGSAIVIVNLDGSGFSLLGDPLDIYPSGAPR
jgi:Tol biopolymer transport system component